MASVTNNDIPEIFNMFADVFKLFKKYYFPEHKDDFWEELLHNAGVIQRKYKTQLCKDIINAVVNDIGRRENKRKNNK